MEEYFQAAATWLSGASAAARLPNETKLEIYGLYKYITTGQGPTTPRPSFFYPAPQAKWDAHHLYANTYLAGGDNSREKSMQKAMQRYMEIARQVGWDGSLEDDVDLDNLSDDGEEIQRAWGVQDVKDGTQANAEAWRAHSVMARPNGTDEEVQSPLHYAVSNNNVEEVQKILENDERSVNSKDEFGYTALHLAADRGFLDMTRLLLRFGADKGLKDQDGQTPIQLAEISCRDDIIAILQKS
ncbi:hypothetical protein L204_106019 [Cryptococcus depauperatus]